MSATWIQTGQPVEAHGHMVFDHWRGHRVVGSELTREGATALAGRSEVDRERCGQRPAVCCQCMGEILIRAGEGRATCQRCRAAAGTWRLSEVDPCPRPEAAAWAEHGTGSPRPAYTGWKVVTRTLVSFSMAALLVACSSGSGLAHRSNGRPPATSTPTADIPASATPPGGCGESPVYRGPIPAWLEVADGYNSPSGLPWVVATPPIAAAFLWRYPLRAGPPGDKILWVVRTPRDGSDLEITARPLGAASPTVSDRRLDNSGPGEIYPDGGLDVPTAGCWRFDLRWANSQATIDLDYV